MSGGQTMDMLWRHFAGFVSCGGDQYESLLACMIGELQWVVHRRFFPVYSGVVSWIVLLLSAQGGF